MQIQLILFLRTVVYQGCTFQTFNTFQASLCSRDGAKNKWCPLTQHPDSGSPRVRFRNPGFQHSFTVIQQAVRLGTALSNVLQSQPKVFNSNTDRLKSNKCFTRGGICKLRPGANTSCSWVFVSEGWLWHYNAHGFRNCPRLLPCWNGRAERFQQIPYGRQGLKYLLFDHSQEKKNLPISGINKVPQNEGAGKRLS